MKLSGDFVMTGFGERAGFTDATKINHIVAFCDLSGVDSIRLYVNDVNLFNHIKNTIPPFSRVKVDFDYNPAAKSVQYALSLLDVVKIDK